jgi:hypothetical protein
VCGDHGIAELVGVSQPQAHASTLTTIFSVILSGIRAADTGDEQVQYAPLVGRGIKDQFADAVHSWNCRAMLVGAMLVGFV